MLRLLRHQLLVQKLKALYGAASNLYYSVLANPHPKGLDPRHDTPVEILHVILFGSIKYLWRNVIQNQLIENNQLKKDFLATRLSSFNVAGLGISPLAGWTLVMLGPLQVAIFVRFRKQLLLSHMV